MAKTALSDLIVGKLKPGDRRRVVWDSNFDGRGSFGVKVSPNGRKDFILDYRIGKNGQQRRVTLGEFGEGAKRLSYGKAKAQAYAASLDAADGADPFAARLELRKAETFEEVGELYMEVHAYRRKRPSSAAMDHRLLRTYLYPVWRKRKARDLRRRDVMGLLDRLAADNGPILANRVRALLSKLCNVAVERELIEFNPVAGTKKPAPERSKDRYLSADEIRTLWGVLESEGVTGRAFKMMLLTGQRPGEVAAMDRRHVADGVWTVPAEVSKNGRESVVPLSDLALELLDAARSATEPHWVFPGARGGHVRWFSAATARVVKACGFKFSPHDLRRTCATHLGDLRVSREVIVWVLNHADRSVTGVYDKSRRLAEKRAALERWSARVRQIVTAAPAKVVRLSR